MVSKLECYCHVAYISQETPIGVFIQRNKDLQYGGFSLTLFSVFYSSYKNNNKGSVSIAMHNGIGLFYAKVQQEVKIQHLNPNQGLHIF